MKALKTTGKILCAVLAVLVICAAALLSAYRDPIATINSAEQIDEYPIYTMDYKGTYWFDGFMENGGSVSDEALSNFLWSRLTHGIIKEVPAAVENTPMCTCFVCRNEDGDVLYCRNMEGNSYRPAIVVTTHDGKYDAVATSFYIGVPEDAPKYAQKLNLLAEPYFTADGMNEAGLAISLLSVPYSPLPQNEGKPLLNAEQVCRLVLDNAGTVDEAVALFDEFTLDASVLSPFSSCHFLIADKAGSMTVVELHNGKADAVAPIHDGYMTVTNFYLNGDISSGIGQARYKYIEAALAEKDGVMSEQEALELLASVKDPNTHPEWTCVYNLTNGDMYIMPRTQLDHIHKVEYSFD